MALNNLQERVERSLYEVIRKILVTEGYLPDITNTGLFGTLPYTATNQAAWNSALSTITSSKGFAIELFNNSQTKGTKKVPRIVIIPRTTLPGDVGSLPIPQTVVNVADPVKLIGTQFPLESTHFYYDISLISDTAEQHRILHAVLSRAFGEKKFFPYYDSTNPDDVIFIRKINNYDLPDPQEGVSENIFTYELPDLFNMSEPETAVALTEEIKVNIQSITDDSAIDAEGNPLNGGVIDDGYVKVTEDGITYPAS